MRFVGYHLKHPKETPSVGVGRNWGFVMAEDGLVE